MIDKKKEKKSIKHDNINLKTIAPVGVGKDFIFLTSNKKNHQKDQKQATKGAK